MNARPPACDDLRSDATLRALAEHDALEPSRSLDRAVLARAREAAAAENSRARRGGAAPALRWSLPAALAAAAICAVVVQRTTSRSGPAPAPGHRFFTLAHMASSTSGEFRGRLVPSFIEATNDLSVRVPPPRAGATTGARATAEWMPRAAAHSSQRAFPPDREWTARRPIQPFELIDSVATSAGMRSVPPPPPAQARPADSSSRSVPGRSTSSSARAPAGQREAPPSR